MHTYYDRQHTLKAENNHVIEAEKVKTVNSKQEICRRGNYDQEVFSTEWSYCTAVFEKLKF